MSRDSQSAHSGESAGPPAAVRQGGATFSIRSILVVTTVMAASAAGAAHLWRAANGSAGDIGPFIIVTSVGPLGLMIVASWCFRLFRNQRK